MTADPFPQGFIKREQVHLDDQWKSFVQAHAQPSPVSIRFNPHKIVTSVQATIPWTSYGIYLEERPSFTLDPGFHGGKYYVQEASSMFLEQAFLPYVNNGPINVLDLCAAPGGKSTHLLSLMNDESLLVSNEVISSRAAVLAENIQKWGYSNVVVTNNDPKDFQRLAGFFDVIVVDAPCSGEGLFRKDPDAAKEWSEEAVLLCSKRQRRILKDVWPALKTGGVLIYSTCTYNTLENEENLKWLQEEADAASIRIPIKEEWGVEEVQHDSILGYRFFPHRVKGEGFFLSVLQKTDRQDEGHVNVKGIFTEASRKMNDKLSEWILRPDQKTIINRNDRFQFFPKIKRPEIELIVKNMRIALAGTYLATAKQDKLIPEHALALSKDLNRAAFQNIELVRDEALKYLRKDTVALSQYNRGFALITFEDIALGWVNVLDTRANNLYPSEWRIRIR